MTATKERTCRLARKRMKPARARVSAVSALHIPASMMSCQIVCSHRRENERTIVPLPVLWRLAVAEARTKVLYREFCFAKKGCPVCEINSLGGGHCDSKAADSSSGDVLIGTRGRRARRDA